MKISVIIPVYNCAGYIAQTLDGIYAQTMPRRDIEVIMYLDAPTDETAAVVRMWVALHRDLKVRVIRGRVNRGVSFARNAAMRYAHGKYIHFMDADDIVNTDFYRALYDSVTHTGADVGVASYRHQRRPNSSVIFDISVVVSNPQDKIDVTRVDQHGMMWRYLIRRDFWEQNKFSFPEDMKICEDWLLANKVVYAANYITLVPDAVYLYRSRENSLIAISASQRDDSPDGRRAVADMRKFLTERGLKKCLKQSDVSVFRLFGKFTLFTISCVDNVREFRIFGKILLMRVSCRYDKFRKTL